jgi:hypothetical protein
MWGLLLVGLLIELVEALAPIWPFLAGGLGVVLLWFWVIVPLLEYRAREARDRLRHERARQQISVTENAAMRAMFNVAEASDVTEGTATELEVRR